MTVTEWCELHCKECTEKDCCVDSKPSCTLSRKTRVKLEYIEQENKDE